jgi:hypothetical protein
VHHRGPTMALGPCWWLTFWRTACRGGDPTHAIIESMRAAGRFVKTDVTHRAQVAALVAAAEEFGGPT